MDAPIAGLLAQLSGPAESGRCKLVSVGGQKRRPRVARG